MMLICTVNLPKKKTMIKHDGDLIDPARDPFTYILIKPQATENHSKQIRPDVDQNLSNGCKTTITHNRQVL